jgi:hypothetical protein
VDLGGAGLWRVRIGEKAYRCLRVLDLDEESARIGILIEAFITEEGRTVMIRRYNGPHYKIDGVPSSEALADSPALTVNGVPYRLWNTNLPADAL